jgi:hypothetical protein
MNLCCSIGIILDERDLEDRERNAECAGVDVVSEGGTAERVGRLFWRSLTHTSEPPMYGADVPVSLPLVKILILQ